MLFLCDSFGVVGVSDKANGDEGEVITLWYS